MSLAIPSAGQSQAPMQPDITVACLQAGRSLNDLGHTHSGTTHVSKAFACVKYQFMKFMLFMSRV